MDAYSVVILTGQPSPRLVKAVGPFRSYDEAEAWIAAEEYQTEAREGEWAVVLPTDAP